MREIDEVTMVNVDDAVYAIFRKFFKDDRITLGTYGRKSMFLMMVLSMYTRTKWASYTIYRSKLARCESVLYSNDMVFCIPHTKVEGGNLTSVKSVIRSLFAKDKLLKGNYTKCSAYLHTNIGNFNVIKTNYSDDREQATTILCSTVVERASSGFFNNFLGSIASRLDKDIVVNDCSINYSDDKPRSLGLMSSDILGLVSALTEQ